MEARGRSRSGRPRGRSSGSPSASRHRRAPRLPGARPAPSTPSTPPRWPPAAATTAARACAPSTTRTTTAPSSSTQTATTPKPSATRPHEHTRLLPPPRRDDDRLPPGQYLERGFPVLSAGPTPHTPLDEWDFSITGAVDGERRWTWEEFQALPREDVHRRHPLRDDLEQARHATGAASRSTRCWTASNCTAATSPRCCDGGYTTNLPVEDVTGGKAWVVVRLRRRAARARARRPRPPARPAPVLLEERQVGAPADLHRGGRAGLLGDARLPRPRRSLA